MQLKGITIEGFKKVNNINLPLSDLNILVGVNGSGKSSVLQATHLAVCLMRQVKALRNSGTATISINDLDYLPTEDYAELGNNERWGNTTTTPGSKVSFKFENENEDELNEEFKNPIISNVIFRSARNAGISARGEIPNMLHTIFRDKNSFFSAYIPGISGIQNREEKKTRRVVMKACSFGDANAYLRNALDLLDGGELKIIEDWLEEMIGQKIKINIVHNDEIDLFIKASVVIGGKSHPLELLGMGYLQLIQIFCYVLLFKPKVLLIDEPDIHLHPDVQEKLSGVLSRVASEEGFKVILSTHSPFIVRGAPVEANIYWMQDGEITDSTHKSVELALGWGAFGKKIIMFSEDKNTELLKKLIAQWPEIDKFTVVLPGSGLNRLPNPEEAENLHKFLVGKYKIVIHRDRDSMIDSEVDLIVGSYKNFASVWITRFSDIEAYFLQYNFLAKFLQCDRDEVKILLDEIIKSNEDRIYGQFIKQRKQINRELHEDGAGPSNDIAWTELQKRHLGAASGKFVFNQLKHKLRRKQLSKTQFDMHNILLHKPSGAFVSSLKNFLNKLL